MALSRASRLLPLVIFVLAALQYAGTVTYGYAWDDKLAITANDYTKAGIRGLPDIFTKRVSVPFKSEYRPVPQALHAVEYQLFGGNPHTGHAFNVLWYAAACVMVYQFARFVFVGLGPLYALLVAALFAVHPLHVEVVANIKSRDEILALVFGLASIMLLVEGLEGLKWRSFVGGAACFLAACLSKENAITLLPLVPLVAWYRSSGPGVSRRLAIAIGAAAVSSAVLAVAVRKLLNTVSPDLVLHLNSTVLNNVFLWTTRPHAIVPTALVIIARYVRLFVVPHPLIHLYGYDQIPLNSWVDPVTWLVIGGLAALAVLVWRTLPARSPLAFGVLWAVVTYSVYSNLLVYAPDTMADRYLFMPSVGLSMVAIYCVFRAGSIPLRAPTLASGTARGALALLSIVLVAFFARTAVVSGDWRNDSTLIRNRIRYMQNNAAAQVIYGSDLQSESATLSSPDERQERLAAAMRAFTQAIRIYPDFQAAWIDIGKLFAEQHVYDKAELAFLKAQRLEPLNPDGYFCLGTLYLAERDTDLATPYLEKAVLLDPRMEAAYVMLGRAYLQSGAIDNLGAMADTARKWFPSNLDLQALLATYYFRKQEYAKAFQLAKAVNGKDPQNLLALSILSSPLAQDYSIR